MIKAGIPAFILANSLILNENKTFSIDYMFKNRQGNVQARKNCFERPWFCCERTYKKSIIFNSFTWFSQIKKTALKGAVLRKL